MLNIIATIGAVCLYIAHINEHLSPTLLEQYEVGILIAPRSVIAGALAVRRRLATQNTTSN